MKGFYFMLIACIVASCGSSKSVIADDEVVETTQIDSVIVDDLQAGKPDQHNISITIMHYMPYCGGMAPTQEMLDNLNRLERNSTFLLLDLTSGKKTRIKTDTSGTLYLNLGPGKYAIRELYKDYSFKEFKAKNYKEPGQHYQEVQDADCYKNWWAANLGEFEILAGSLIQHFDWGTRDRCFTRNNPCVVYTGPHPP